MAPSKREQNSSSLMSALARYIRKNAGRPLSLRALGEQAHLSPQHLQRLFKAAIGMSPKAFHTACRLEALKKQLRSTSVTSAIHEAGFGSPSRIYERTDRALGMTPAQYKSGGADQEISYASLRSPIGHVLIAATDRGVCFVDIGPLGEAKSRLNAEFPRARLVQSQNADLAQWAHALKEHLRGTRGATERIPLDLRGTVFERQVWNFLQTVPEGQTRSYAQVAQALGRPKSARAVANACAANCIAVLIPCHRVLRGTGELGGYRWGIGTKKTLLAREKRSRPTKPAQTKSVSGKQAMPERAR